MAATRSTAETETAFATRYLGQLCKHFQHRVPVTLEGEFGRITFPELGTCMLHTAPGRLVMTAEALDAARLPQLQDVVARHLVRFAFREELRVEWREDEASGEAAALGGSASV